MSPIDRANLSLKGLSVGDGFGECFFPILLSPLSWQRYMESHELPNWGWRWTDDTEMASAIVAVLAKCGEIDQDELAMDFATRYSIDQNRGYGAGAHEILERLSNGKDWREVASSVFKGTGSMGNGGAMRSAPVGAYFADDCSRLIEEAAKSAAVTHAHPEGQAGAIAVALAAAFAWNNRDEKSPDRGAHLLKFAIQHAPASRTVEGIVKVAAFPFDSAVDEVVAAVGNGSRVISPDTVPFALWCAARHLDDFAAAMWTTVSGQGDMDTTCAIVGGIVSLCSEVPQNWFARLETLRVS